MEVIFIEDIKKMSNRDRLKNDILNAINKGIIRKVDLESFVEKVFKDGGKKDE